MLAGEAHVVGARVVPCRPWGEGSRAGEVDRSGDFLRSVLLRQLPEVTGLRGQHDGVPLPRERLGHDPLGHPVHVHVRRVDEGHAGVQGSLDDPDRFLLLHLPPEGHRAEAEGGNLQARASHLPVFHPAISSFDPARPYFATTSAQVVTGHSFWNNCSMAGLAFALNESASGMTTCMPLRWRSTRSAVSPAFIFWLAQAVASLAAWRTRAWSALDRRSKNGFLISIPPVWTRGVVMIKFVLTSFTLKEAICGRSPSEASAVPVLSPL